MDLVFIKKPHKGARIHLLHLCLVHPGVPELVSPVTQFASWCLPPLPGQREFLPLWLSLCCLCAPSLGRRETCLVWLIDARGVSHRPSALLAGTEHPAAPRAGAGSSLGSLSSCMTISTHHLSARAGQGCCGYFPPPRRGITANPLPCCSQTFRELSGSSRQGLLPRAGCSGQHSSYPCLPCKSQEQLDPNLGDTSSQQRSLAPSTAQPCRQPGASSAPCVWMCFFRILLRIPPSRLLCHIWKFV